MVDNGHRDVWKRTHGFNVRLLYDIYFQGLVLPVGKLLRNTWCASWIVRYLLIKAIIAGSLCCDTGRNVVGVYVAYLLARKDFRGKEFVDILFTLPLVLPPTVTGYYLIILFGRNGFWGAYLRPHRLEHYVYVVRCCTCFFCGCSPHGQDKPCCF